MKRLRLITICAVVGLMLSLTGVSWANFVPDVCAPPDAPGWWNVECEYYAYGWWEADIVPDICDVSPLDDDDHWASNFLSNTAFTTDAVNNVVSIELDNELREHLYKEIFIYVTGTTSITEPGETIEHSLDTDGGIFEGSFTWDIGSGIWSYKVEGDIDPQPDFVYLTLTVPGLVNVTDIWAGENCLPEPVTVVLLGLGSVVLLRKRRA